MPSTIILLRLLHHSTSLLYKSYSILPSQSSRLLSPSHRFETPKPTRPDRDESESKNPKLPVHGRACPFTRYVYLKCLVHDFHGQLQLSGLLTLLLPLGSLKI